MCTRDNILNHLNDDNTIKQTVSMHEENLACIEENPLLISTYGIKSRSELNKLMFFNTVSQQPFDILHDIFESIAVAGCPATPGKDWPLETPLESPGKKNWLPFEPLETPGNYQSLAHAFFLFPLAL